MFLLRNCIKLPTDVLPVRGPLFVQAKLPRMGQDGHEFASSLMYGYLTIKNIQHGRTAVALAGLHKHFEQICLFNTPFTPPARQCERVQEK